MTYLILWSAAAGFTPMTKRGKLFLDPAWFVYFKVPELAALALWLPRPLTLR